MPWTIISSIWQREGPLSLSQSGPWRCSTEEGDTCLQWSVLKSRTLPRAPRPARCENLPRGQVASRVPLGRWTAGLRSVISRGRTCGRGERVQGREEEGGQGPVGKQRGRQSSCRAPPGGSLWICRPRAPCLVTPKACGERGPAHQSRKPVSSRSVSGSSLRRAF